MHLGLVAAILSGPSQYWWVSLGVYFWFASIGNSVGQHRYFAHKTFKTNKVMEWVLLISATLASVSSVFGYVVTHREHHKHTDKELDPHSPHHMSLWQSWTLDLTDTGRWDLRNAKDWIRNKGVMNTHKYFFGFILLYVILLGLIDPLLIVYGYLVPASLCVFATGAFNTWGHGKGMQWAGYRTWETNDRSVNHHLVNLITFGEGWHNNHHSRPGDYTNSMEWWEWDINAWIIRLIKQ
jgi:stearoyl-CoA desaturase (delta-9 desaturase)